VLPSYSAFDDGDKAFHFGPAVSSGGLMLYKLSQKALIIFRVGARVVDFRVLESKDEIKGPRVLRGSLEDLELILIGQNPVWTKYEMRELVCRLDFLTKWMKEL
jgi:hypothetical protein